MNPAEIVGYAGSVIVLHSRLIKLRWINPAGAVLFSLYGRMIRLGPIFGLKAVNGGMDA